MNGVMVVTLLWIKIFSVRGRLLLAFLGICTLASLSTSAALFSFHRLRNAVQHITEESAPVATDALRLSRQVERIVGAAPLILTRSATGQGGTELDIPKQLTQLKQLLKRLEQRRFEHKSLLAIRALVYHISLNLDEFENIVQQRNTAREHTQKLQKEFSTLLVRLQRPLFPAMILLDAKTAQFKRIASNFKADSLTKLALDLHQLQRVEKIMLETTSISDKLNGIATETSISNLDVVIFPLRRSIQIIEKNIKQLGQPYQSELNNLYPDFVSFVEGKNSLADARRMELQSAARGEELLTSNRDLSSKLTYAVDQLVAAANRKINGAANDALNVHRYGSNIVVVTLLLTLLSSGLIVWLFIERNLIRRINTLRESMLAVASGSLEQELPPPSDDELGKMAGALTIFRNTARVVQKSNIIQLRKARDQAEQASRMKSEFLANMSHELRTPLNAVIGITEMLLEGAHEQANSAISAPLERISAAGRKLLRLINELLDLASIESGRMCLNSEHTDIDTAVAEAADSSCQLAVKNNNEIDYEVSSNVEMIYTDPLRLRQILLSLISNACKFTHNGNIKISVCNEQKKADGDYILFEVTDNGIGIDAEYLPDIFREFSQSDGSTTRRYGGTGLGLAVSQRLSRIMGGNITVTSTSDKGSVFTLKLPVSAPQAYYNTQEQKTDPDNPQWKPALKKNSVVQYSKPIAEFVDGVSVPTNKVRQGLKGIKILGTLRGFTPFPWHDRIKSGEVELLESDSLPGLIRQSIIGRIDGVYANVAVVQHLLENEIGKAEALKFDIGLPFTRGHYRLSTINQQQVIDEFNQWMLNNKSLIQALRDEYFNSRN